MLEHYFYMRNIFNNLVAGATACILLCGCYHDVEIGNPIDIHADYNLPQGDASEAANARIQGYFDRYGCYFLYNFEVDEKGFSKDVTWVQQTGTASERYNMVTSKGDPKYVDLMLDLLEETWLNFFPEDFLANGGIPYRVFMCDSIYQWRQIGDWYQQVNQQFMFFGYSISVAGLNSSLKDMSAADKLAFKQAILPSLWSYYMEIGILDVPDAFYELTDYSVQLEYPGNSAAALEAWRKAGYLPLSYDKEGKPVEFWNDNYYWGNAKRDDLYSYLYHLRDWSYERIQPILENSKYTVIRKKYEILQKYYLEKYGIDLRAIGDATYSDNQ